MGKKDMKRMERQARYRAKRASAGWRSVTVSLPAPLVEAAKGTKKVGVVIGGGGFQPVPVIIEMRGQGVIILHTEAGETSYRLEAV